MLLDPIQSRAQFGHALRHHYAILAVNADSHAAVTDVLEAAREARAPVIIEASLWQLEGRAYGAGDAVLGLARYLADLAVLANGARHAGTPVMFHTDHIKGPKTEAILAAALRGVGVGLSVGAGLLRASTISIDASSLTDEENVSLVCRLAEIAAASGAPATIEMEANVDEGHTAPERTRRLVGPVEAGHPGVVWLWAPGLGTRHGLGEGYPEFRVDRVRANVDLVRELTGRDVGLALHGSSGLEAASLAAAARAGVVKVNWSSESLLLRSSAARAYYGERAPQLDPGHPQWKAAAMDNGVQGFVAARYVPKVVERMKLLGGADQGPAFLESLARGDGRV
ncbi:MAG TPA: class II fructose-bisphosphate aldolase [Opitutaceae bacterium]|nr:class II fructose-bisphosphate aldolase [Opitutaceae bacterium]